MKTLIASILLSLGMIAPALASNATLDLLATAPVTGTPRNIGVAAGLRLGLGKSLAVVPLANFTDINGKVSVEQGLAFVVPLNKSVDLGVAEIARPGSALTINQNASYAPSVVLGFRF